MDPIIAQNHCRTCLKNLESKVWGDYRKQTYHLQDTVELKNWILACWPLQTLDAVNYPQYVCAECFDNLKKFYEFQDLVGRTATQLDAIFRGNLKVEPPVMDIEYDTQKQPSEADDSQDECKFIFEAEDTALIQPTLNHSVDDDARLFHRKGKQFPSNKTILSNIDAGIYKVSDKVNSKSGIWNVFGEIKKPDGKLIEGLVLCRLCTRLVFYDGKQTLNLIRHHCYTSKVTRVEAKAKRKLSKKSKRRVETHEEISHKIATGLYKITEKQNGYSAIWAVFGEVQKDNGTTIGNIVYCRMCSRLLKYNGKQTSNLVRHSCYTPKTNSTPPTDDFILEDDPPSISAKTMDNSTDTTSQIVEENPNLMSFEIINTNK